MIEGLPPEEAKGFYGRLEKTARKHLDRLAAILKTRKVSCQVEVVYGHRAAEVVRFATEVDCRAINRLRK